MGLGTGSKNLKTTFVRGELVRVPALSAMLQEFLSQNFNVSQITDPASASKARELWITFFVHLWKSGSETSNSEGSRETQESSPQLEERRKKQLLTALPNCTDKFTSTESEISKLSLPSKPLTTREITDLGVDLPAKRLLVAVCPKLALQIHGRDILKADPDFACSLPHTEYEVLTQTSRCLDVGRADPTEWGWIRKVVKALTVPDTNRSEYNLAVRALPLAITLFKRSKGDESDFELMKNAYLGCDRQTKRQVKLVKEIGSELWSVFGERMQREIVDAGSGGGLNLRSGNPKVVTVAEGFYMGAVKEFDARRIDLVV